MLCFRRRLLNLTELNWTSVTKSCYNRATVLLESIQLRTSVSRRLKQAEVATLDLSSDYFLL